MTDWLSDTPFGGVDVGHQRLGCGVCRTFVRARLRSA